MAKKTAKSKPRATKPAAKKAKSTPKAAPKTAAPPKPQLSDEMIGDAAGDVWNSLHSKGALTLPALKKAIDRPSDVTLMAVGWLAREGKLDYVTSGRTVKVALR